MIQLTRSIAVQSFDAEATIALGRDRPELLAVAQLARDAGRAIVGKDVTRELLAGLPEHVGWLVIDRCVHLGLLVQRANRGPAELSAGGRIALEHGQVMVPEEGVFRFYFAVDPLLDSALLHVLPIRSAPGKESRGVLYAAKRGDAQVPVGTAAPGILQGVTTNQVMLSVVNGSMFEVKESPRVGQAGPGGSLRLELRWESGGQPLVFLTGSLPGPGEEALKVDFQVKTPTSMKAFTYDSLWTSLISWATKIPTANLDQWRQIAKRRVLPSTFAQVPEAARRSFNRDVDIPPVRFQQLGEFQASKIQKAEIVPDSPGAAQEWCHWLQWDAVSKGYATPTTLEAEAATIRSRFPHHNPAPLTPEELLARAQSERAERRTWNLLAPFDLGLWSRP